MELASGLPTSPPSSSTEGGYTRLPCTETNTNSKPSGPRQIIDVLIPTTHAEATAVREPGRRILSDANPRACFSNQLDGPLPPIVASEGGNEESQPPKAAETQLRRKSDHTMIASRSAKRQKGARGGRPENSLVSALVEHSSESSATKISSQPGGLIDPVPNHTALGFASDHAISVDTSSNMKASTNVIDVQFMIPSNRNGRSNPLLPAPKPFIRHFPKPSTSLSMSVSSITPRHLHSTAPPNFACPLYHLDLPVTSDPPEPQRISMPPRIAQRVMTDQLSIILTTLSDSDRGVCLLVSKSWRYAGTGSYLLSCQSNLLSTLQ